MGVNFFKKSNFRLCVQTVCTPPPNVWINKKKRPTRHGFFLHINSLFFASHLNSTQLYSHLPPIFFVTSPHSLSAHVNSRSPSYFHHTTALIFPPTTTMEEHIPERVQAVRPIHPNSSKSEIVHFDIHQDSTGKDIVLWSDILTAFKGAISVRNNTKAVLFLKDDQFNV